MDNSMSGWARVTLPLDSGTISIVQPYKAYATPAPLGAGVTRVVEMNQCIQDHCDAANPGDVILIKSGNHKGSVRVTRAGTSIAPIRVAPYGDGPVTIQQEAGWQAANPGKPTWDQSAQWWTLLGLDIRGSLAPGSPNDDAGANAVTANAPNCGFVNLSLHHGVHCGLKSISDANTGCWIEGCAFWNNGQDALDHGLYWPVIGSSGARTIIRGCVAAGNADYGYHLYSGPAYIEMYACQEVQGVGYTLLSGANSIIAHNVMLGGGSAVGALTLYTQSCHDNNWINNVVAAAVKGFVAPDGGVGVRPYNNSVDYNIIQASGVAVSPADLYGLNTYGAHNQLGDPVLADVTGPDYDLRLGGGSPGIGAAGTVTLTGATAGADIGLFSADAYTVFAPGLS